MYTEKEIFSQDAEQDKAVNSIKDAILTNAIAGPDPNLCFTLLLMPI